MSRNKSIIFCCFFIAAIAFGAWWVAHSLFRENWGWSLSLLSGAITVLIFVGVGKTVKNKPAPFQLVLRLANDKGGDQEDDQIFETLHSRFKQHFSKASGIRFDGFDTDGSFIWFYFFGMEEASVRQAILAQLEGCRIRQGSYFLSKATQSCAEPDDGSATFLGA